MYDGKTGDFVGQMNDSEGRVHKGGVYGVSRATYRHFKFHSEIYSIYLAYQKKVDRFNKQQWIKYCIEYTEIIFTNAKHTNLNMEFCWSGWFSTQILTNFS